LIVLRSKRAPRWREGFSVDPWFTNMITSSATRAREGQHHRH
jgi:hypothetical protein